MYNRYIPQPDGTHLRRATQDAPKPTPPPPAHEPKPVQTHELPAPTQAAGGIGSFFRQILPAGFDTADLIVVLLLLLMASEKQEGQNTALLTLALYLFL